MSKVKPETFYQHHKQLIGVWNKNPQFKNLDAILIKNGKDQIGNKIKTSAISMWYFGFDFVDTIVLITKKTFAIIGGSKKILMLKSVKDHPESKEYNIVCIEKDQNNNSSQFKQLFDVLEKDLKKQNFTIGTIAKEVQIGPFMQELENHIKNKQQYNFIDCSVFIQDCLAVKDHTEISYIAKAAKASVYLQQKLIREVETIIEEEGKKSHSSISSVIENLVDNEKEMAILQKNVDCDSNNVDLSYIPIVQSGGKYDLKPTAQSNEDNLSYDTIIVSLGAKYMEYHSNVVRTLFIDPTDNQKKIYLKACELLTMIAVQLKPETQLKTVYENAVKFINEKVPELKDKIPTNFGFGIGLEFRDSNLYINAKNEKLIEEGMVFNVVIGFDNLSNEKNKPYAIQISDIVAIRGKTLPNSVMTSQASKSYDNISYSIQNQEDEKDEEEDEVDGIEEENILKDTGRTRNSYYKNVSIANENQRIKHQLELKEIKQKDLQTRLRNNNFLSSKNSSKMFQVDKIQCYKGIEDFPQKVEAFKVNVDFKHNCLLLPINGDLVPFHISLLKNFSKNDEHKTQTLRLNFHHPGSNFQNITFPKISGQTVFIKELTFRSKNGKHMVDTIKQIKELQNKFKQFDLEAKSKDELIEQDKLQLRVTKRPALRNLKVRPAISKQKINGMIELHLNGFRYVTTKNEKIDIIFKNIKHAFFQPCINEMIVAIHFNLKNPLIIGKKKVYDIQFYTEAGLPAENLSNGRNNPAFDDEQMEKNRIRKLNKDFESFYKDCESQLGDKLKFEVPFTNLSFYGSPIRSTCLLQPTQNTLMNIIETPFFILSLEEVELACFERMIGSLKNFDLVFVFKNYEKPVSRISSIPTDKAEIVKSWLDSQNLLYFQTTKTFSWVNILKTIRSDIAGFVEDGGWNILLGEGSEAEDEDPDDCDDDFSLDDDDESASISDSDDDDDDEFDEFSDDESGQSWSDLEKKTKKDEYKKRMERSKSSPKKRKVPPPSSSKRNQMSKKPPQKQSGHGQPAKRR